MNARRSSAFTLIELMVVCGIMGLILAAGIPTLYKLMQKEGMRKATSDVVDLCGRARAQAILKGSPVDVIFHPVERHADIGAAPASAPPPASGVPEFEEEKPPPSVVSSGSGSSVQIPEDILIEMLDINLMEYKDSDWARVRFYPNGTSDELTLILHSSSKNDWKKVSLEVTTGLASVDEVTR